MNYVVKLKRLGGLITDLVFPVSCLVCGADQTYLCDACLAKLPRLEKQKCLVCQKPAPFGKTHPDCVTKNSVDGAIAGLYYKDRRVNEIIRVFKYKFVSELGHQLSFAIVEAMERQGLSGYFQDFVVVPVPLHRRRQNWRGFNQSHLLAKALAEKLAIDLMDDVIVRSKNTKPQANLKAADARKSNIEGAFVLNGTVAGKKILLVDDLVTSGSTANEMAKILKRGKASEVWIISAAHG
jgi:ComF family protein